MPLRNRWKTRQTRHELLKLKDQLELAKKAHTSLEEKYKALIQEAQHVRKTLVPFQKKLKQRIEKAYSLLSEAVIYLGLRRVYRAGVSSKANDEVEVKWTTIRGVSAPKLISKIQKRTPLERGYPLSSTNYLLDTTAEAFEDALTSLIEVAELENIHRKLEKEGEKTRIRVSALEKILIPSLEDEIKLIENKLEEKEREHNVMIKWVKENLLDKP
ncbi:MAG: V-type ATP synthase subunit D [Thermoproteota archaeon]